MARARREYDIGRLKSISGEIKNSQRSFQKSIENNQEKKNNNF